MLNVLKNNTISVSAILAIFAFFAFFAFFEFCAFFAFLAIFAFVAFFAFFAFFAFLEFFAFIAVFETIEFFEVRILCILGNLGKKISRESTSFLCKLIWQTSGKKTHLFEKKILLSIFWRRWRKIKIQNELNRRRIEGMKINGVGGGLIAFEKLSLRKKLI